MTVKSKLIQHRGLCARYTRNGENVPSGNRDPETGITPMDNFVCWRCQSKAPRSLHTNGETGGEMADGTSASNRTGVSRFVTGDFAVQRRFSAASTLQEQTVRADCWAVLLRSGCSISNLRRDARRELCVIALLNVSHCPSARYICSCSVEAALKRR